MRALLGLMLAGVVIVGGLKLARIPVPFLDYAVGAVGGDRPPGMPEVQIDAPGFGDFDVP
jgi:hypothetical protein